MVLRENGSDGQRPERRICLRVYRPEEVQCLRQILVLRKLRVPLKEIGEILNDPGSATAISVFEKKLLQMDDEIKALQAVRDAVEEFKNALKDRRALPAGKVILQDSRQLAIVDALSPSSTLIQEERKKIMENLKQAEKNGKVLTDVCIVHLPESDVAAAHVVGDDRRICL